MNMRIPAIIHICPSGHARTLCGLDKRKVESSDIGAYCNCLDCDKEGQRIIDRMKTLIIEHNKRKK